MDFKNNPLYLLIHFVSSGIGTGVATSKKLYFSLNFPKSMTPFRSLATHSLFHLKQKLLRKDFHLFKVKNM